MLFLRESFILYQLKHQAIVHFRGINFHSFRDSTKLEPTILTKYYPNGSLKEILDKEKSSIADLNWNLTKKYICLLGISDAMRYLHEAGIIHRDLKPQNVLIDSNYYPHVCDFGLSRCFSNSLTNSIQFSMTKEIGTPLYMAPELFENEHYGSGVDVYAFAMLAYEIVTGQEPFAEKGKPTSIATVLRKISEGNRPDFTKGVQDNMKELITKCWSQDPKERPSFETIFEKLSSDFSYFDETVDEDEIYEYLEMLDESKISRNKSIKEQNKEEEEKDNPIENIELDENIKNLQEQLCEKKKGYEFNPKRT